MVASCQVPLNSCLALFIVPHTTVLSSITVRFLLVTTLLLLSALCFSSLATLAVQQSPNGLVNMLRSVRYTVQMLLTTCRKLLICQV